MLAELCYLYGGTTPTYWLDQHSLEDWSMYLEYGEELMVKGAQVLIGRLSVALAGKSKDLPKVKPLIVSAADEKPDREAFYRDPYVRKLIERR